MFLASQISSMPRPTLALPHACHRTSNALASARGGPADFKPKLYNPRRHERTILYQTIAKPFANVRTAAYLLMALPELAAMTAGPTTS